MLIHKKETAEFGGLRLIPSGQILPLALTDLLTDSLSKGAKV